MKKPYTKVSLEIQILVNTDVITSSGYENVDWSDEPSDDLVLGDIFQ